MYIYITLYIYLYKFPSNFVVDETAGARDGATTAFQMLRWSSPSAAKDSSATAAVRSGSPASVSARTRDFSVAEPRTDSHLPDKRWHAVRT